MFFRDHERAVYKPDVPGCERAYDPLRIDNLLVFHSQNAVDGLLADYAPDNDTGDVSDEGKTQRAIARAAAEIRLADLARLTFELPAFPDCTDGTALSYLFDYLEWMRGKGTRGGSTPG